MGYLNLLGSSQINFSVTLNDFHIFVDVFSFPSSLSGYCAVKLCIVLFARTIGMFVSTFKKSLILLQSRKV